MGLHGAGIAVGASQRGYRFLDGTNRLGTRLFTCQTSDGGTAALTILERRYIVRQLIQSCTDADGYAIQNTYWVDVRDGFIWQSRQWVSEKFGRALIQVLKRN